MIYIASDHGGYELKEVLKKYLAELGESCEDLGPTTLDFNDDYPDYASKLAETLLQKDGRGILLCRNAIGVCVVANKFRGVRAGIGYSTYAAKTMREDDDVNVLCLPADALKIDAAKEIVRMWLSTPFSREPRHQRRIAKIADIEREHMK